jgi:phage terminase large subunit-like protein
MDWQREVIEEFYECDEDGNPRYRWGLLGVPKGNGKSPLDAWIALYHLLGEGSPSPWIVCAAASDKQADIVFGHCRAVCELSDLARLVDIFRWEIRAKNRMGGKIERVACSGGKLDGKTITLLLADELHEWEEEHWTILTQGALKRDDTRILSTTTAGYSKETVLGREYDKCLKISSGEVPIANYYFKWWAAPDGADYTDRKVWAKANPGLGTTVSMQTLEDSFLNSPKAKFVRYRLNGWTESEDFWLPRGAWERLGGSTDLVQGQPTWVAWDGSRKIDSTAIVCGQWAGAGDDRRLVVRAKFWERPLDLQTGQPDESWRVPVAEVESFVRSLAEEYDVRGIAYDPAFIQQSVQELEMQGLPMVEWPQTNPRMVPASERLYEAILNGEIEHNGDATLARHIRNCEQRLTRDGGWRLDKSTDTKKKNDGGIALAMLIALATMAAPAPKHEWGVAA